MFHEKRNVVKANKRPTGQLPVIDTNGIVHGSKNKTKQKQKAITKLLNKLINLKIHLQTTVNLHTTREKRERNAQTLENVTR